MAYGQLTHAMETFWHDQYSGYDLVACPSCGQHYNDTALTARQTEILQLFACNLTYN